MYTHMYVCVYIYIYIYVFLGQLGVMGLCVGCREFKGVVFEDVAFVDTSYYKVCQSYVE